MDVSDERESDNDSGLPDPGNQLGLCSTSRVLLSLEVLVWLL